MCLIASVNSVTDCIFSTCVARKCVITHKLSFCIRPWRQNILVDEGKIRVIQNWVVRAHVNKKCCKDIYHDIKCYYLALSSKRLFFDWVACNDTGPICFDLVACFGRTKAKSFELLQGLTPWPGAVFLDPAGAKIPDPHWAYTIAFLPCHILTKTPYHIHSRMYSVLTKG